MKKLFSIVLMGAALLVSTNAKAVVVNDEAALRSAIAAGATIQLGGSGEIFTIAAPLDIEIDGAMILDLNGHNLEYAYNPEDYKGIGDTKRQQGRMINLKKGTLTIKNDAPATGGWIKNNTANFKSWSFGYYASASATTLTTGTEIVVISVTGSADPTAENYTVLNVNEGVKLSAPDGKVGIIVNAVTGSATIPYATYQYVAKSASKDFSTQTLKYGCSFGVVVNMNGYAYGNKYGVQISGNNSAAPKLGMQYDFENMDAGVAFADAKTAAATQGYGTTGYKCNWAWAGDFIGVGAEALKDANFPKVNIGKTGECASLIETTSNGNGLYCAGYSETVIEGYCHGSNGVYVKAGDITINNAVIESENPNYTAISGKTDREGAGNALVCESNASYPGETKVTIMGDTKLEAISGFAIEDKVTTAVVSTTDVIEIQGGTFIGGEEGGIITNTETDVKIENGNFTDTTSVKPYLSSDNYTITTADGTMVVCSGTKPTWETGDLKDDGKDYQWKDKNKIQTISSNITVGFFDLEGGKVIVENRATLTVNRLILGADTANIIVKVGGRLIVDGDMGIVANTVGNITIEAEENNMGQFLFNPIVNSNRHPLATVNFTSKAWGKSASEHETQIFGIPMLAGSMVGVTSDNNTAIQKFDVWRETAWSEIGYINYSPSVNDPANLAKFDKNFGIYCITSNNAEGTKIKYTFTGNLLGNTQPDEFRILKGWTSAANSWTGNADPAAMIAALEAAGCVGSVYTYVYDKVNHRLQWQARNGLKALAQAEPMQPIMFCNEQNKVVASNIMNYEQLVWNFRNGAPTAPARQEDFTKAIIRIADATGFADEAVVAENDAKYNAPKYPNEAIRVYVNADQEYDIFATENVDNTFIGFNAEAAGKYTVSFNEIQGENLVLVDLVNNKQVAIVEGAEYEFEAKANEANPYRFQVRKIAEQATAVENVEAEAKADGVYTITGQFVGMKSMLNNLPAGVYVVDGKKVVK